MKFSSLGSERIVAVARLVLAAALGLALLLGLARGTALFALVAFIFGVYVVYAVVVLAWRRRLVDWSGGGILLAGDVAILAVVVLFAPALPAAFLLFFVYFTLVAGLWRGWRAAAVLSVAVSLAYLGVVSRGAGAEGGIATKWVVVAALLAAGTLVGTVAERERRRVERTAVLETFGSLLSLDTRWVDLWERWLKALCQRYGAKRALLAYRDTESDHVLLWDFRADARAHSLQESDRPPRDARTFLLEAEPVGLLGVAQESGRWRWQQTQPGGRVEPANSFSLPGRFADEFTPGSLLSVSFAAGGRWRSRVFLLDGVGGGFRPDQLDDLQQLLEGLRPALTTLLTIQGLIAGAVNQERERVVRELHDGVAQTLASVEMQLSVFRRLAERAPEQVAGELGQLQQVVQGEREEFRRFLRALKPVRVTPGELAQWLLAHCAQLQQETGIQVETQIEPVQENLPEGVCREVVLILREALHNVRKHAGARQVLVRLRQDENCLRLVVDDDGRGMPFSGTYTQEALMEKGLAPVSICERLRGLGGTLTIESTPGSGLTLRMEIPLA